LRISKFGHYIFLVLVKNELNSCDLESFPLTTAKDPPMPPDPKTVLVTGDVIHDHQIYLGERLAPDAAERVGTQECMTQGGAGLLYRILREIGQRRSGEEKSSNPFKVEFGLREEVFEKLPSSLNGYSLWKPFPFDKNRKVWRLAESLGYGCPAGAPFLFGDYVGTVSKNPDVVAIDDGGLGFRQNSHKAAWPVAITGKANSKPRWVVLKMSSPVGQGDLWRHLSAGFRDNLVVIVSSADIRREEVRVSRGVSWERTALDLVEELCFNSEIRPLLNCRHLIVHFGSEGALHVDTTAKERRFLLAFDPIYLELEWKESIKGDGFGFMACLTAGIVDRLMQLDHPDPIHEGIRAGLSAMRTMLESGHGNATCNIPRFPLSEVVKDIIALKPRFAYPWIQAINPDEKKAESSKNWTILNAYFEGVKKNPRPLFGVGRRVAIQGTRALGQVPCARFGKLFTADRSEIESLRSVYSLIKNYDRHDKGKMPLSIAVFGPPGAGKSFGIKEIAKGILGENVPILEFNLSQFKDHTELNDAFHQVRDKALGGTTPVVFWDEFDSKEYYWLQYLLAPMQDGKFLEGQINHPIGKSVFVFAGGTSYDVESFGPKATDPQDCKDFRLKKGPDFKSRLSGYINVLGPNRRQKFDAKKEQWCDDMSDVCYPIRRALLLRSMLGLKDEDQLNIDHGILSAIIETKRFTHGARSLEKIILQLKKPGADAIRRSYLPSEEILSMHADTADFTAIVNRDLKFKTRADELAPFVHDYYRRLGKREKWLSPLMDKDFEYLPPDIKEDNRAAAARIPHILDLVGLYVVPLDSGTALKETEIRQILDANIEMLAEAEHNDWMHHKIKNGWSFGEKRDNDKKIHDCLKSYVELVEKEKEKDRNSVRKYPEILKNAKYTIVAELGKW